MSGSCLGGGGNDLFDGGVSQHGDDGRDQYAVLANNDINRTVQYSVSYAPPEWVTERPKLPRMTRVGLMA